MGKHLTIEEKHNAANELIENREKIKELKQQIYTLRDRNKRLERYLYQAKYSKHNGLFAEQSESYQKYGKKIKELSVEEKREYYNKKKQESRVRLGRN